MLMSPSIIGLVKVVPPSLLLLKNIPLFEYLPHLLRLTPLSLITSSKVAPLFVLLMKDRLFPAKGIWPVHVMYILSPYANIVEFAPNVIGDVAGSVHTTYTFLPDRAI